MNFKWKVLLQTVAGREVRADLKMKGKWADLICWGDGGRGSAVGDGDRHQRRVDNCARTLSEKVLQGSVLGNPALCPSGVFMEG